jgi:hypothetical protein
MLTLQLASSNSAPLPASSSSNSRDLLADSEASITHKNTHINRSAANSSSSSSGHKLDSRGRDPAEYLTWHWSDWHSGIALVLAALNFVAAASTGQGGTAVLIPIFTALLHLREFTARLHSMALRQVSIAQQQRHAINVLCSCRKDA